MENRIYQAAMQDVVTDAVTRIPSIPNEDLRDAPDLDALDEDEIREGDIIQDNEGVDADLVNTDGKFAGQ